MNVKKAYDAWSEQYDSNENKTRDLEAHALRTVLKDIPFEAVLEIGCGTGKNTEWFITRAKKITAVDLSLEMLNKAKEKISSEKVLFLQSDITKSWDFSEERFDLISFSLVLEHIEDLDAVFSELSKKLARGGHVYIGELHPFKQYTGSKARFETENGEQVVACFNHHISDFIQAAKKHELTIAEVNEFFDGDDRTGIPRILTLIFEKK
jgi:ubiquinone/menaquinone biosynthesis C-methylase UbiE